MNLVFSQDIKFISCVPIPDRLLHLSPAGCPSSTYGSFGNFSSSSYPSNYPNFQSCSWGITVPGGYRVRVRFQAFQTEYNYDYLKIYDGSSSSSPQLASLSGSYYKPVFTSSGRHLWFHFQSDDVITHQGFNAQFEAIPDSSRKHDHDNQGKTSQVFADYDPDSELRVLLYFRVRVRV